MKEEGYNLTSKTDKTEFKFEEILKLCSLEIPKEKEPEFRRQVEKIIEYFEVLSELDLEGVEPTTWKFEEFQRMQDDIPEKFEAVAEIIEQFPRRKDIFAVVPQVIEEKER